MTKGKKIALGCGGVGCLGIVLLLVLIFATGTTEEAERRGREWREQREGRARVEAQHQIDKQIAVGRDGRSISLTTQLFAMRYDGARPPEEGKVFPDNGVAWKVSQNIEGDGDRYATYEYVGRDVEIQFAVKLERGQLEDIGAPLRPGCYRYDGRLEARNMMGTLVPVSSFERVQLDHPACHFRAE